MGLIEQSRELCWAIEELPASEQQTEISIKASSLLREIQKNVGGQAETHSYSEPVSQGGAVADVQKLLIAIRDLDQRERLILTMYYNEKLTLREIASIFDWTVGTTQKQFENIINKLKIATASL